MAELTRIQHGGRVETGESGRDRLARLQRAQIAWGRRALILFDGWEASGRGSALRRVAGAWDPCHFAAHCLPREFDGRHWLAPYWERLPGPGRSALFRGSWHAALAQQRALERVDDRLWSRRCDEINEFEAQQRDQGTILVKLFLDVAPEVQQRRLSERDADPWRSAFDDECDEAGREALRPVWSELFERTDTRWAPWLLINANDGEAAGEAVLDAVAEALERDLPADPPGWTEEP